MYREQELDSVTPGLGWILEVYFSSFNVSNSIQSLVSFFPKLVLLFNLYPLIYISTKFRTRSIPHTTPINTFRSRVRDNNDEGV